MLYSRRRYLNTMKLKLRDGTMTEISFTPGQTLYEAAEKSGVASLLGMCGGNCSCAQCQVYFDKEDYKKLDPPGVIEEQGLSHAFEPKEGQSRLSCGLVLNSNMDGMVATLAPLAPKDSPVANISRKVSTDRKIAENVYWLGVVDYNIREMHGYETGAGSTYNAFIIDDEMTTIIDTVKYPFKDRFLKTLEEHLDGDWSKVRYVVCNHAEPDHSSSLPYLMEKVPWAPVVCNKANKEILSKYYDTSAWKWKIVKDKEELNIGKKTLKFINIPLAHWPESMVTYDMDGKILFSSDVFGQHYASIKRFSDEVSFETVLKEAKTYYANILMRLAKPVKKALKKVLKNCKGGINMVCTAHGQIFRDPEHIAKMVELYEKWSNYENERKVVILYDSMWNSTDIMAHAIADGVNSVSNMEAKVLNVRSNHITTIAEEVLDAAGLVVGSPVLNEKMMPLVGNALTYLEGLRPLNKKGFAFSSYGWSALAAINDIRKFFKSIKLKEVHPEVLSNWKPGKEVIAKCQEAGRKLAEEIEADLK